MTSLPGYDAWKTQTPPYLEDGPEPQGWESCRRCDVNWEEHWGHNGNACCQFVWDVQVGRDDWERCRIDTRDYHNDGCRWDCCV